MCLVISIKTLSLLTEINHLNINRINRKHYIQQNRNLFSDLRCRIYQMWFTQRIFHYLLFERLIKRALHECLHSMNLQPANIHST